MLVLMVMALAAQAPAAAAPPANCTAPEHRQFDFWVGEWDVTPTANPEKLVAHSLIEAVYNGCGIRENWMPLSHNTGGSLNNYDTAARKWRQTWIDSSNSRVDFEGEFKDGKMVLIGLWKGSGGPGKDQLTRMTYSQEPGGAVRQLGEVSSDGGKSWGSSFDFTYRPGTAK